MIRNGFSIVMRNHLESTYDRDISFVRLLGVRTKRRSVVVYTETMTISTKSRRRSRNHIRIRLCENQNDIEAIEPARQLIRINVNGVQCIFDSCGAIEPYIRTS